MDSTSLSVSCELINQQSMIRSAANSIHEYERVEVEVLATILVDFR
jgi:hypothetical protein